MSSVTISETPKPYRLSGASVPVKEAHLQIAGVVALVAAGAISYFAEGGVARFAHAYLLALSFCLTISLGALFFVILQHLTNARWSVTVRRIAEILTLPLPILGLLFAPVLVSLLFGSSHLYEWNDVSLVETDELIRHKSGFLNAPFFAIRCIAYFSVWSLLVRFYCKKSLALDEGDLSALTRMRQYSGPAMIAFALTLNFAAFDLLMSLDAHWFSTIFGVYLFGGCVVAFFAALPLLTMFLQSRGLLREEVTVEHYHDLGKLLFGFVFFWGYIAFSQYLLIWYANIPEETFWFAERQTHGWQWVSLLLIFGHFFLPFLGLMSKSSRRHRKTLTGWCVFLLLMHLADLYWLIMPSVAEKNASPQVTDVLCVVGVCLLWAAFTLRSILNTRLLNTGDPNLQRSIAFHNH